MSNDAESLLNAVLRLPEDEREQFAQRVYESLEGPTPEQAREIERRIAEVRSGKVQTIPGDEAFSQILDRLRLRGGGQA